MSLSPAVRLRLDGMLGNTEPLGDFALRHALDPAQLEDLAAAVRQGVDQSDVTVGKLEGGRNAEQYGGGSGQPHL
jgi:hypothetical protein